MSHTTPAPIVARELAGTIAPGPAAPHPVRRFAGPLILAVGAALAAVGMGLHISGTIDELAVPTVIAAAPGRWFAAHLFEGFGFVLVAVGVTWALPRRRGRGATLTTIGVLLTSFGAIVMAISNTTHGAVGLALTEVDPATSLAVHEVYFEHPAILGLNVAPMLLSLGMILLGAGLLRSRTRPRSVGVVLVLAPIAVNAAFGLALPTWVHGLPIVAAMTALAWTLTRAHHRSGTSDASASGGTTSTPRGVRGDRDA